jgi:hypothetical protein
MNTTRTFARSTRTRLGAGVLTLAAAMSLGAAGQAQAIGTDVNGGRIHWNVYPCSDGASGTSVNATILYDVPSAGTYQTRLGLYRSTDDGRLALGPLVTWTRSNTTGIRTSWSAWNGYTGNTELTAFVFKWNGSSYALVARETIPCL